MVQLNVRISEALLKRLDHYRIDRRMSRPDVVTAALEGFLGASEAHERDGNGAAGPRSVSKPSAKQT